ncbi:hypothetical protein HPY86_02450 [candidate division WOR-3 bacterium]|nr:hypothetical protein [candidate division WOR-3 bacterium]
MWIKVVLIAVIFVSTAVCQTGHCFEPGPVVPGGCHNLQRLANKHCPPFDEPEFLLDTSITRALLPFYELAPAIASDGTNSLVVWMDSRKSFYSYWPDIFGARLSPSGTLLDPQSFEILSIARHWLYYPAVAFDGTNYLVVWEDGRHAGWADIYGARVTCDGVVLDSAGFPICTAPDSQKAPAVAFDGTNYLVVWADPRFGISDIYGARVTPEGVVLDPAGIPISTAPNWQGTPSIAFDGRNYFVVWADFRNGLPQIYGTRVTPEGAVLDTSGIPISTVPYAQLEPACAFDGKNFLVVWQEYRRSSVNADIYGARVTPEGAVLDTNSIPITTRGGHQINPAVAFDGTNYLVVWADQLSPIYYYYDIYGTRVTRDGLVLDPQGIAISSAADNQKSPAVAFDGTNWVVVWQDERNGSHIYNRSHIYSARVTPEGVVLDPWGVVVSGAAHPQWAPTVSFGGTNFLVAWQDDRSSGGDIYGTLVTEDGVVLDPDGLPITTAPYWQGSPASGYDGKNYLVVWTDCRSGEADIYGARVTPEGVVLDPNGIQISTSPDSVGTPAVAFDGTNYLVVWQVYCSSGVSYIYGARVTPEGVVLDPNGITIATTADYYCGGTAVAFDGTNYLVVWTENGPYSNDIYGARVTPEGVVLDPQGIAIGAPLVEEESPAVAFDGTNYLVVWCSHRARSDDIFGARVTPAGVVLDPGGIAISTDTVDEGFPDVSFDGTNYLVVWQGPGTLQELHGARVTPNGMVFPSVPVVIQEGYQLSPVLAHGHGSQLFLVYISWTGTVAGKVYNTYRIWGKMNPIPGVEEYAAHENLSSMLDATIIKNVLRLSQFQSGCQSKSVLIDAMGREIMVLVPGENDVRGLTPGVYFVRTDKGVASRVVIVR